MGGRSEGDHLLRGLAGQQIGGRWESTSGRKGGARAQCGRAESARRALQRDAIVCEFV